MSVAGAPRPAWFTLSLDAGTGEIGFGALPARPGVAGFEDEFGRGVLTAQTADLRALAKRRLERAHEGERSRRVDLRGVTRRIRACEVGSAFEADWVYLETARTTAPASYRAAADRWQAWFLRFDPGAPTPTWRKTRLVDLVGADGVDPATLLGPMGTKDAAGRYGELLDDLFDLCRYPRELARAPEGRACAYKEMGKCPAACDGSEPMEAYRARAREAVRFACGPVEAGIARTEVSMRGASERGDFEAAARARDRAERMRGTDKGAWRYVDRLDRFRFVGVLPSTRRGWARVFLIGPGTIECVADAEGAGASDVGWLVERLDAGRRTGGDALSRESVERVGIVCRHLFHSGGRAGGGFVSVQREGADARALGRLIRSAARAESVEDVGESELESGAGDPS